MEGELQQCLGRRLRMIRTTTGLSQEDFADRLGIHRTYIGGLERGERNVTLRTVERIAERLGIEAMSLLDDASRREPVGDGSRAPRVVGTVPPA
ncbi:MAG: helix-turn-helix transcriptional regulator [Actinomycetota bacterium]|nr:helix-turn-helix transcriptional regulator [Actinomycetota bacterium]MDA8280795.1 helix-turn-helix transcriptional regulator [Actinomycetota bacterium]